MSRVGGLIMGVKWTQDDETGTMLLFRADESRRLIEDGLEAGFFGLVLKGPPCLVELGPPQ